MKFLVDSERGLLTTRLEGESIRRRLEAEMSSAVDLGVCFDGVDALTISFADEFLGRLLTDSSRRSGNPFRCLLPA